MKITSIITDGLGKLSNSELITKLSYALDVYGKEVKTTNPDAYWDLVDAIHVAINGEHFSKEVALMAASKMENVDGTTGEHWTYDQTTEVAKSAGIAFDKFNEADWYYALNMFYSDFSAIVGSDTQMYIQFAKAWLMDADAPDGKAYIYWKEVIMYNN